MHRAAAATQWRTGRNKKFVARGRHAVPGKFVGTEGCSHEVRGAAAASPGFTTSQGRRWVRSSPKGSMAPASPHSGFADTYPFIHVPIHRQGQFRITKDERHSRIGAGLIGGGVAGHGGRPVGGPPSFVATYPSVSGAARHCTTGRSKVCRTPASRPGGGVHLGEGVRAVGC